MDDKTKAGEITSKVRNVKVTVTDADTKKVIYENTGPIAVVGVVEPSQENVAPQVPLFYLGRPDELNNLLSVISQSIMGFINKILRDEIKIRSAKHDKRGVN